MAWCRRRWLRKRGNALRRGGRRLSHGSSIGQAFLGEARLRCTVKFLCSGLVVAALFRETGQCRAVKVFSFCLDLAAVVGQNDGTGTK
jgi:hypothetical protein